MSLSVEITRSGGTAPIGASETPQPTGPAYRVIRRNGSVTPFDPLKITVALTKAFLAVEGNVAAGSRRVHDVVEALTADIVATLKRRSAEGRLFHIEEYPGSGRARLDAQRKPQGGACLCALPRRAGAGTCEGRH